MSDGMTTTTFLLPKAWQDTDQTETGELARELCSACQRSKQARLLRQVSKALLPRQEEHDAKLSLEAKEVSAEHQGVDTAFYIAQKTLHSKKRGFY
ncbi:hypothetical protein MDA_GLEAN10024868 [Myotis davidii]|uniref:Uncharacterized protein n=1 Tax=Myotis davidii TaxID=225400 RepID=L5LS07_MYODS|nr:hypothetical protein MDA_GLEAN10024868 [Myotis davidii]